MGSERYKGNCYIRGYSIKLDANIRNATEYLKDAVTVDSGMIIIINNVSVEKTSMTFSRGLLIFIY
jgi:hypothetical protein